MSRVRITVTEVKITKAGQVKNFQIKLPENAIAIIGVATDIRIDRKFENVPVALPDPVKEIVAIKTVESVVETNIATRENTIQNPLAGKIKLQSLEKANIFYAEQVWVEQFDDGIGNVKDDFYTTGFFALLQKAEARKVHVPADTTIINAMYKDLMGAVNKRDVAYSIKVLLWIETDEKPITEEKEK
jgi:hypothetical protein